MPTIAWRPLFQRLRQSVQSAGEALRARVGRTGDVPAAQAWLRFVLLYLLELSAFALGFLALGALGFWLKIGSTGESLIWPPAALALVVLWLRGYGMTPGILLGWWLLAEIYHLPQNEAASLAVAQVVETVIACFSLRKLDFDARFTRLPGVMP